MAPGEDDPFKISDDPLTGIGEIRLARGLQRGGWRRRLIAWVWLIGIIGGIAFLIVVNAR